MRVDKCVLEVDKRILSVDNTVLPVFMQFHTEEQTVPHRETHSSSVGNSCFLTGELNLPH